MKYTKKMISDEIAGLDSDNYFKQLLEDIEDEDELILTSSESGNAVSGAPSYMDWLRSKGYIDDEEHTGYVSPEAERKYAYSVDRAQRDYEDSVREARSERMDAGVKANTAYIQATSPYGNRAGYLAKLGLSGSGAEDYYAAEAYRQYRGELQNAASVYDKAMDNAVRRREDRIADAELTRATETATQNRKYAKEYEQEMTKLKEAEEQRQYNADMNDYYYRYHREEFSPDTLYRYHLSGKIDDEYYDDFVTRYNADLLDGLEGMFSGTIQQNREELNGYRSDPLLKGDTLDAIEQRFAETQKGSSGLTAMIIDSDSPYINEIQGREGEALEDLMPYFKNALGAQNTQFVLMHEDGTKEYYRVATFDLLGAGKDREEAEAYIRGASDGNAVIVEYNNKRYLTDGNRIFRIVFEQGR